MFECFKNGDAASVASNDSLGRLLQGDKMEYLCTEEMFLSDVKEHEINIVKDDSVYRFVRFRRADSSAYWFDLST